MSDPPPPPLDIKMLHKFIIFSFYFRAVERLYRSFQPDFDLFGYDVEKYRQVAKKD